MKPFEIDIKTATNLIKSGILDTWFIVTKSCGEEIEILGFTTDWEDWFKSIKNNLIDCKIENVIVNKSKRTITYEEDNVKYSISFRVLKETRTISVKSTRFNTEFKEKFGLKK